MSRKKLKALTFLDYGLNLLISAIGLLSMSWFFRFNIGSYLYSILFSLSLFMFMYSRGSLAAKIDMRAKEENLKKSYDLALPLVVFLVCVIAIYSLFYFDILPAKNVVLKSGIAEDGTEIFLYLIDVISLGVRFLFLNLVGFLPSASPNPLVLLISPVVAFGGSFFGYYCKIKNISLLELFLKAKTSFIKKFNE